MSVTRPVNLSLPFANSGSKNTIPVASQIGITNGAASYTDGFPPLTMTPIAAGGTPPFGQDMNGALFAISAHTVFLNAGGKYRFDAALATAVGGYAVGAVLQSNDGLSSYYNVLAGNTTDFNSTPASIGVSWMPWSGLCLTTNVIQTSSSTIGVTTGTANAIVVTFTPAITAYTNGMTLSFDVYITNTSSVTINAGAGVVSLLNNQGGALVASDLPVGTRITASYNTGISGFKVSALVPSQYLTATQFQSGAAITAVAGGTADALTASFTPAITAISNQTVLVRAASANLTTTPTFAPNAVPAMTIVKGNNLPLAPGDIAGAAHWLELTLDATLGKAVLQNPANSIRDRQINFTSLTSSGNFITPANITNNTVFKITLVAGGGGGGGANTSNTAAGGGGAGGAATFYITGLSPNTSYAVVIGAGGSAGSIAGGAGGTGGTTQITIGGTVYSVTGGVGGVGSGSASVNINSAQGTLSASITALTNWIPINQISAGIGFSISPTFAGCDGAGLSGFGTAGIGGRTGAGPVAVSGYGVGGGGGVNTAMAGGVGAAGLFTAEWNG